MIRLLEDLADLKAIVRIPREPRQRRRQAQLAFDAAAARRLAEQVRDRDARLHVVRAAASRRPASSRSSSCTFIRSGSNSCTLNVVLPSSLATLVVLRQVRGRLVRAGRRGRLAW